MTITGYETGTPRTCGWCWEKTTAVGVGPGGLPMPLHVTCAMQMTLIRRRLERGATRGDSLAWRRYFRFTRTQRRIHKAQLRLTAGDDS